MRRAVVLPIIAVAMLLVGCGERDALKPVAGQPMPVAPYGAKHTPTSPELLTPSTQQRPARSDDINSSIPRRSDEFDLPPPN